MSILFLKLTKIWQLDTVNSSISTTLVRFEDAPARNAFEYLQNDLYCQKLQLLTYILFVYLYSNLCSGLQNTHLFCTRVHISRSSSFKVIQDRWFWYQL